MNSVKFSKRMIFGDGESMGLFGRAPAPPKIAPAPAVLVERLLWWSWSRFEECLAKRFTYFHEWIEEVKRLICPLAIFYFFPLSFSFSFLSCILFLSVPSRAPPSTAAGGIRSIPCRLHPSPVASGAAPL